MEEEDGTTTKKNKKGERTSEELAAEANSTLHPTQ
jgi:hypothetical protein